MIGFIYLPHVAKSTSAVGREFYFNRKYRRHLWKNREFDLTNPAQAQEFNKLCEKLIYKQSIYTFVPLPYIVPPEPCAVKKQPSPNLSKEASKDDSENPEVKNPSTLPQPDAPLLPSRNGKHVVQVLGGYALYRTDKRSKTGELYRGVDDIWINNNAVKDPFQTVEDALAQA